MVRLGQGGSAALPNRDPFEDKAPAPALGRAYRTDLLDELPPVRIEGSKVGGSRVEWSRFNVLFGHSHLFSNRGTTARI